MSESVHQFWNEYYWGTYKTVEEVKTFTVNGRIGCAPITLGPQKVKASNGLLTMSNQNTLTAAVVVVAPEPGADGRVMVRKGDTVYFPASLAVSPWAKQQFELDGEKVIFVPASEVVAVRKKVETVVHEPPQSPQPYMFTVSTNSEQKP